MDNRGEQAAENILASLERRGGAEPEQAEALQQRVAARQKKVGFDDYKSWMEKVGEPC